VKLKEWVWTDVQGSALFDPGDCMALKLRRRAALCHGSG